MSDKKLTNIMIKSVDASDLPLNVKESLKEHYLLIGVENTYNMLIREAKKRGLR